MKKKNIRHKSTKEQNNEGSDNHILGQDAQKPFGSPDP